MSEPTQAEKDAMYATALKTIAEQREQLDAITASKWVCFHCGDAFQDEADAREHFGSEEGKIAACRLSVDDMKQLRELEADNADLRHENERLDYDARLWHESEADRVRRIGNCQWWQEFDFREGERLVLREQLDAAQQQIAALTAELAEAQRIIHLLVYPQQAVESERTARMSDIEDVLFPEMDYPTGFRLQELTKSDQHHEKCSFRTAGMLCDCAVMVGMLEARRDAARRFNRPQPIQSTSGNRPQPMSVFSEAHAHELEKAKTWATASGNFPFAQALDAAQQQIATLTAERDNLRQAYETVQDNEFAAMSPSTHAQNLAQQVRTLTAENARLQAGAANRMIRTMAAEIEQLTAERDEAQAELAKGRALLPRVLGAQAEIRKRLERVEAAQTKT